MLKLYTYHNSICSQKTLITLSEKDLSFETQDIDLLRTSNSSPGISRSIPRGSCRRSITMGRW